MKNQITASVEFYFKGIQYEPTLVLDLDEMMQRKGEIAEDLHTIIAEANNINTYSYEFEMMESEEIVFCDAQGLAADFVENGEFDADGFIIAWHQAQHRHQLEEIARTYLSLDSLDGHPNLEAALKAAFDYGKNSAK